jgi:dimethylamine monooxygenase subunit C
MKLDNEKMVNKFVIQTERRKFTFVPNRRKSLILAEETDMEAVNELLRELKNGGAAYSLIDAGEKKEIADLFARQKIGTYLYLAGTPQRIKEWTAMAVEAGFTEEEMQTVCCGAEEQRLFCAHCHHIQTIGKEDSVRCSHCGMQLEVSSHYSRLHDAYYGYIQLPCSDGGERE